MPSIVRSQKWFCRVTVSHVFAKSEMPKILAWLDLATILAVTHIGDKNEREHIHMVVSLSSELQKQSFDHRIKTIYGVRGSDYSSKPWDGNDSACGYLFHDQNAEIIANKGYTPEDVERFRRINDDVQKVIEINNSRASGRHVDKVIQQVLESGSVWSRMEIMNEFIRRIRAGEMYEPGDYLLKRYVEEVYVKTIPEEELSAYAVQRFASLWRT